MKEEVNYRQLLDEKEMQLVEERKLIDHLTRENQAKSEQIVAMETAMNKELEKLNDVHGMQEEEATTAQKETAHTIQVVLCSKLGNI